MLITFEKLTPEHIPLLRKWLKEPHVAEFWHEPDDENEFREKFLGKLQRRGVQPYIIHCDRRPIGYIQEYEACLVGGGWWPDERPGTFGIDQFIGESTLINKGLGTKIIREFVSHLFKNPRVKDVITDPDPSNARALRVYEKVGFKSRGRITTPAGEALLLRMDRIDKLKGD